MSDVVHCVYEPPGLPTDAFVIPLNRQGVDHMVVFGIVRTILFGGLANTIPNGVPTESGRDAVGDYHELQLDGNEHHLFRYYPGNDLCRVKSPLLINAVRHHFQFVIQQHIGRRHERLYAVGSPPNGDHTNPPPLPPGMPNRITLFHNSLPDERVYRIVARLLFPGETPPEKQPCHDAVFNGVPARQYCLKPAREHESDHVLWIEQGTDFATVISPRIEGTNRVQFQWVMQLQINRAAASVPKVPKAPPLTNLQILDWAIGVACSQPPYPTSPETLTALGLDHYSYRDGQINRQSQTLARRVLMACLGRTVNGYHPCEPFWGGMPDDALSIVVANFNKEEKKC